MRSHLSAKPTSKNPRILSAQDAGGECGKITQWAFAQSANRTIDQVINIDKSSSLSRFELLSILLT
jgi:hypothetical protein